MKDKFLICCIENEIDLAFDKWLKWSRVKLVHRAVKLCSLSLRARIFNNTLNGLAPSFGLVVNKRYLEFSSRILITNDLYLLRWGFQELSREQVDVSANKMTKYCSEATTLKSETNLQSAAYLMTFHVLTFTTKRQQQTDLRLISLEKNPGHSNSRWLNCR